MNKRIIPQPAKFLKWDNSYNIINNIGNMSKYTLYCCTIINPKPAKFLNGTIYFPFLELSIIIFRDIKIKT